MEMLVECILKRAGGTKVDLDGIVYHFTDKNDRSGLGRHIAIVGTKAHVQRFMQIPEGYQLADDLEPSAPAVLTTPAPVIAAAAPPVTLAEPDPVAPPPVPVADVEPTGAEVAALPTEEELADMDLDALRLQAEKEIGRKPSPKAKEALLISQILASRQPA